jgi:PAS domain S-box-containing protein
MNELPQILIVEGDAIVGSDVGDTLARCGYEVIGLADSVERALSLARAHRPDLLLVDLRLGQGAGGIEAARLLREECGAPVVFMTGFSSEEVFKRAREVRPAGFLRKPFSAWELQAAVENAIEYERLQRELEERGGKFLNTLRSLSEAVIASDLEGRITFFNPSAETLTGYKESEVVGQALSQVMDVQDDEGAASLKDGEGSEPGRLLSLTAADGQTLKILERSVPLRDEQGEVKGLVTLFRRWDGHLPGRHPGDGEESSTHVPLGQLFSSDHAGGTPVGRAVVRASREKPNHLIEGITDPLLTLDEEGVVTYANPEANACLSDGEGVLIGQSFSRLFSQAVGEECGARLREVAESGRRQCFEVHDEVSERWFELNVYPRGGGWLILLRDATARQKESLRELRAHRLEGLSLLARGFTHDFNNLLTVLIGNLSLIKDRYPEDEGFQGEARASALAADQARRLVQQLMTFTKGGVPILTETKVAGVLRRVLDEHRKANPAIRYQLQCSDPTLTVRIDPEQIALLLENLVKNAEEAMVGGGRLDAVCELSAEDQRPEPHEAGDESYMVIKISDSGHGMDDRVSSRVFEPYFTTRKEDNASGIGLTVCESIAKAHRGHLELSSEPGQGTTASLYLPLELSSNHPRGGEGATENEVLAAMPVTHVDVVPPRAGAIRILILEDEELIRQLIVRCLRKQGYEVMESKDGKETIRLYSEAMEAGTPFDLVLSDLTIEGGMGGIETMLALRQIDPRVRAIVSSGYSDAPAMANPGEYGFMAVLPKPYPPQDLIRTVAAALATAPVATNVEQGQVTS